MRKHTPHFSLFACLCLLAFMVACQPNKKNGQSAEGTAADSSMIDTKHFVTKKIHVGSNITHLPLCSQLIEIGGVEKYALMDRGYIFIFDWEKGLLEDSIPTAKCGNLSNFSGFTMVSADSVLVYNQSESKVFLINHEGNIEAQYKKAAPAPENYSTVLGSVNALNHCRMQWHEGKALIHGNVYGCLHLAPDMRVAVSEWADLKEGKGKAVAQYPSIYGKENWGGIYMNEFSAATDAEGNTYYSFPISAKVLKYNADFSRCDTLLLKSRHDTGIAPCTVSPEKLEEEDRLEVDYYLGQPDYRDVMFDSHHNLLVRMAELPRKNWDGKSTFVKSFTFIVSKPNGDVLSESSVIPYTRNLNTTNMHLCKEGIAIAANNKDEENIYFECFKINE